MGITAKNRPQNFIDSAAVVLQFFSNFQYMEKVRGLLQW